MARPSPQSDRILLLMELLRDQPRTGRTLAEIARHLGVAKATCYPMLVALADAGWLVRHPTRKTFHLGPALIPLGQAAAGALDVIDLARPAMRDLADMADMACLAFVCSGEDLVVTEAAQPHRGRRGTLGLRLGDRIQIAPPLGSAVAAWFGPDRLDRWYRTGAEDLGVDADALRDEYDEVLALTRQRGYAVECLDQRRRTIADELTRVRGGIGTLGRKRPPVTLRAVSDEHPVDVLVGIVDPDAHYRPISINAVAFDADTLPALVLCLVDAPEPMTGRRVVELGESVRGEADRLTELLKGCRPVRPQAEA
ncbi:IclR family transcriptional regulator [Mycobacterium sp. IS-1496]|uniref:IclR family transcriptional regulator n=1 Tax=Mycobacterium sp. IS-1496 TaxID=1772284 RepID=UPI0007415D74|nr:helix-turn-helix domain-containing protein [Mycobacterium sp. IS-1496]KUI24583.1 IclR family transcriptional regulator [Mycobacterium sp. IS-1496]